MAVDIAELRKLLALLTGTGTEPEDGAANGIGEADITDPDAPAETPANPETAETPAGTPDADTPDGAAPDAGAGADNAAEAEADTTGETLPESEVSESELRDSLNRLAAENETLRNRLAELAGDAALDELDPTEAALDAVEDIDEQDDEAAQADIDEQLAAIAALRG